MKIQNIMELLYGTPLWNSITHSAISDHEAKLPSWQIFPTKYVIPQKFQV